jgi:DNA-binding MarR family transcriptional regulator
LNGLIHGRTRLSILAFLAASESERTGFNDLKEKLGLSPGNLSVQLKKLEGAGYLSVKKEFRANRPYTGVSITTRGRNDLERYVDEMEKMIRSLRNPGPRRKK